MDINDKIPRIAIVVSHPIQHFCPQYISYTNNDHLNIKVFFASTLGFKEYNSPGFGKPVVWSNLGLDQFPHEFLNNNEVIMSNRKLDAPDLEGRLDAFAPDVIVVYGYWQKYQRRAMKYAKNAKKKVFYISDGERRQQRNQLIEIAKSFLLRNYFKKIDAFLSVGNANENYYKAYGIKEDKIFRTPFPIDIKRYEANYVNKEQVRKKMRAQYGIENDWICCSVVGKLVDYKSQLDIIKALNELGNTNLKILLLIIGTGRMQDQLEAAVKKNLNIKVRFTGFVDPIELPGYYAATDIYVHPAKIDPHPLAISEAIYMGCPVIVSDRCGSYGENDDVQDGHNGFVYEWGNIDQLKHYIEQLSNDIELRKRFGEYSHNFAVNSQQLSHSLGLMSALKNNGFLSD